jgi:protein SDA1
MPGAVFYPPVASMDPLSLEGDGTRRRRREGERLAEVFAAKQAKYGGKQGGGGTTNKEKARKKNFLMLRKSSAVQSKMRKSLVKSQKAVRKRLASKVATDKRLKQVRRKT